MTKLSAMLAAPKRTSAILAVMMLLAPVSFNDSAQLEQALSEDPFLQYMDQDTLARMRQQEKLQPAVELIQEALAKEGEGFVDLAFSGDGLALTWKGQLSPAVQNAVQQAETISTVTIRSARFSRSELEQAAARIENAAGLNTDLQSISIKLDGSGLTVQRKPLEALQGSITTGRTQVSEVVSQLGMNIPVAISTAKSEMHLKGCSGPCSRLDDESPWNAGGYIASPTNGWFCSSGFAVRVGLTYKILTAAHCGSSGDYFTDWPGETIGYINLDDWDRDVATIGAPGWYWMWDGPDMDSTFHKTVKSSGFPVTNELLCQSGRNGVKCDLETDDGLYTVWCPGDSDGDQYWMHNLSTATQTDGEVSAEPGDSGGPVFSLDGTGVRAKGVVSATIGSNNETLIFSGMSNIISRHGYSIRTG